MKLLTNPDTVVIHASATKPSMDIGQDEINSWHQDKGWAMIGYHFVIRRNGAIEGGRPLGYQGAHVKGHNDHTIGICMVGGIAEADGTPEDNFTGAQYITLALLNARLLREKTTLTEIKGHRDFPDVHKACPCFDAIPWAKQYTLLTHTMGINYELSRNENRPDP